MKFNSGAGPRLELDVGSALDIGSCVVDGIEIAPGRAVPDDGDPRILHSVGGFLFTCGPDHIRHPEPIEGGDGRYPLHGSMAGTRAAVLSELSRPEGDEVIATFTVTMAQGGTADVLRKWRMNSATGEVLLEDQITNSGTSAFVPMLMYHINLGAHLFSDATKVSGSMFEGEGIQWTFGEGDGHVFCVQADPEDGDLFARVVLGPIPAISNKSLHVRFSTQSIPHLQMWRNQAAPAHVLGIEPVSHPWKTREQLHADGLMVPLEPGEMKMYQLSFCFQ